MVERNSASSLKGERFLLLIKQTHKCVPEMSTTEDLVGIKQCAIKQEERAVAQIMCIMSLERFSI